VLTIGITGSDTGVGKTTVACAMLAMLGRAGASTAAMKPVETGVADGDPRSDAARLRALATVPHPLETVRPYRYDEPVAPMVAGELDRDPIEVEKLDRAFDVLRRSADVVIVEGAGGVLVPLAESFAFADLFRRWSLEVIIVAANRLGALNHVMLTERALRAGGCPMAGIVLVDAGGADRSSASNASALARLTSTPLFQFPWLSDPYDARALADAALHAGLDALVPNASPSTATPR
jgi:dethiobiotin synthetase